MSGVVSCLTSPACSYCCGGLSAFAVVFLLGLSSLFRANYPVSYTHLTLPTKA